MVTVAVAGVVTVLALWRLRRSFLVARVRGDSMLPTLRDGDRLVVRRRRPVRPGQLVVARSRRGGLLVKRAAAVAGDPVPVDRVPLLRRTGDPTVPTGRLVVLGDNPAVSLDSRVFGYLSVEDVVGVGVRLVRGHR